MRSFPALLWTSALATSSACFVLLSGVAAAHITLLSPPSWVAEDYLGNPQKDAPCGGDSGMPTGSVSGYRAGSTITVEWQELVGHPGHFRIALAKSRDDLQDPYVTTSNGDGISGNSISAEIEDPPTYPVLLDGLFPRDMVDLPRAEPFSVDITLPMDTCERCTLQVIQFMADHVPNYFYHHCADLRIVGADEPIPVNPVITTSSNGMSRAGSTAAPEGKTAGGCSLASPRESSTAGFAVLFLLALLPLFRRRCSPGATQARERPESLAHQNA
jgi:hypothetical protein